MHARQNSVVSPGHFMITKYSSWKCFQGVIIPMAFTGEVVKVNSSHIAEGHTSMGTDYYRKGIGFQVWGMSLGQIYRWG